ncbi:LacI family DNA-binding transcriptional regulator [Defluviitalea saccharophila]|uniref:LacI family DNA-binding transcriptional regulator n=1 Tax=Defluviitalea saccharophila TaxID=879970 RepID=A0ABZ2YB52_9FIRM
MVTIKELAERAGVSPTTVSNVLHGRTNKVSPETLQRVEQVIKEANYVSNMGARLLANNGSKIIGVLINYGRSDINSPVQDPFFSELIGALEGEIRTQGYYMMLYMAKNVEENLKMALAWNVEGLIAVGFDKDSCAKMKQNTQKPIVFIDCYFHDDDLLYTNVGLQDKEGAYEMTKYLLDNGHRKIAFLADDRHPVGVDAERLEGYKLALEEKGIQFQKEDFIFIGRDKEERTKVLDGIIKNVIGAYSALFFASDFYAANAIYYFNDHNIKVPEDISVVGFDDNVYATLSRPMLTTMHQDVTQKATIAIQYVLDLIAGRKIEVHDIKLSTRLVIRGSVKKL